MQEIIENLKSIGLEDKEARVYVALLKFGEANVGDIADEASIKRPTTYIILDELRKKGLVLKIPNAKKIMFQAKTPDEFFEQTVEHVNKFEKLLPKLRSMNPSKKGIKTLYFEGINGVKDALAYNIDSLKDKSLMGFWAKADKITEPMKEIYIKNVQALKKRNVVVKGITPLDESVHVYKEGYTPENYQIRSVSKDKYAPDVSIEIADEFVRIVDPIELKAIVIENPRVTDAFRQIFKLIGENE